jgi:hypothetical protein
MQRDYSFGFVILLAAFGCAAGSNSLEDGVYPVLREGLQESEIQPLGEDERIVVHDYQFLGEGIDDPPRLLIVPAEPAVPFVLAREPEGRKDDQGNTTILITLAPEYGEQLRRFTSENQGTSAALIVGGKVYSVHKIRTTIKGGLVQISCCREGAGTYLFENLKENYRHE